MNFSILPYRPSYRAALIDAWEQSVRATHGFLAAGDLEFYKAQVEDVDFESFDVYCALTPDDELIGLMGVEGAELLMLFLRPEAIGKGIGRALMQYALDEFGVTEVEVNEDNAHAVAFYEKFGFRFAVRKPLDAYGKPYPILRMKLAEPVTTAPGSIVRGGA
jgi:putative acetyltransferase